jgi:NADH-quinone oxidoreductase subunit G
VRRAAADDGAGGRELVEVSWPEALAVAAEGIREVLRLHGPSALGVLGGARGTNEDAYVWSRLAKAVWRTDNVDCQLDDGLPAELVLGLPRATIDDCDRAKAVVLLAPDVKEELPVLFLRLRRAALELQVPLIEIGPVDTGLSRYASARVRHLPGDVAHAVGQVLAAVERRRSGRGAEDGLADEVGAAAALLTGDRPGDVVVVLGRPNLAETADATVAAAARLARGLPGTRFLSALRRANVHGALDMGLAPGFLPGRVALDDTDHRAAFAAAWGGLPEARGLDARAMLQAAAAGRLHGLVLLGADPVADFPDRGLAERAIAAAGFVVAVDPFLTASTRQADVVLPPAVWGEKTGTASNLEGRVQLLNRKVTPAGVSMSDWRIAAELALRFSDDFDLETVEEVQAEMARVAPSHRNLHPHVIRGARDGVVVPLTEVPVLVGGPRALGAEHGNIDMSVPQTGAADPDAGRIEAPGLDAADAAESNLPAAPGLYHWEPTVVPADAVPPDGYALRLVVARTLYDGGTVVSQGPSLAQLAPGAFLRVHPTERERLGVPEGGSVRASSTRGSAVLAVRSSGAVPRGVAFLAHRQPGAESVDLVDADAAVTDLRVETV